MRCALLAIVLVVAVGGRIHANEAQNFVSLDPEPVGHPWWLRAKFHPFETEVREIPIQAIRKTWCKASEFRRDLFPEDLRQDLNLQDFAVDGFFDGSKTKQTFLVGAYETCDGIRGRFFLLLGWTRQRSPIIRFVREVPTDHQFAVLRALPDSSILIWDCMNCDTASRIKWDRSKRGFVSIPDTED